MCADRSIGPAVADSDSPQRLLVVLPTWVGDGVMATPLLRALRRGLPGACIVGIVRKPIAEVFHGLSFLDNLLTFEPGESLPAMVRRLRAEGFDTAIVLSGSFKSALRVRLAQIPRRIGYARDGRGWLLTDQLHPPMNGRWPRRSYTVTPTLPYYLRLLEPLGIAEAGRQMELAVTNEEHATADRILAAAGLMAGDGPFVLLNPGANYGAAKLWPPKHYAAVADRFTKEWGARVAASVAPNERAIAAEIQRLATTNIIDLAAHGLTLGAVKEMCRRADLVVTNDTGTRHIAAAMGTRLITVFGPTDPKWTTIDYPLERELQINVPCGPCQLKTCPLPAPQTKQCLHKLTPDMVFRAASDLMSRPRNAIRLPVVTNSSKVAS